VRNGFFNKNFEFLSELGDGTFAAVIKVKSKDNKSRFKNFGRDIYTYGRRFHQLKDKNLSAIKFINNDLLENLVLIREFLNFSELSQKFYFNNEYLVKHLDAWFELDIPKISLYIQMELCDTTLKNVIVVINDDSHLKTNKTLATTGYYIASQIFIQILEGVNYLHKLDPPLIHRDLKPENIFLNKCDRKGFCVKIADFGNMAIHKLTDQSHTSEMGSGKYMAPEVVNNRKYDTKADVYSLGVILGELFDIKTDE
jgi:serine/threonine protein kinase